MFLGKCSKWNLNFQNWSKQKRCVKVSPSQWDDWLLRVKKIAKIVNSDWLYSNIDEQVNNLRKGSSFIASNVSHLGKLRSKNPKSIIFSYININSIRNKFENLCDMVGNNVDVLSIAETKLDSSFPNAQFLLPAFQEPLRLDINHQSGGLLVYIKVSLPSNFCQSLNFL